MNTINDNHGSPANPEELESYQCYLKTLELIHDYLGRTELRNGSVMVRDGNARLVLALTNNALHIEMPIEMPFGAVEALLRHTGGLLDKIIENLQKTVSLTGEQNRQWEQRLGKDFAETHKRAEQRTLALENIIGALQEAASGFGIPYHPVRLARCHEVLQRAMGTGDPRIVFAVTTYYAL